MESPLTEEASQVVYRLPNLRSLSVDVERETSLPSASLPNLTDLTITCDDEDSWPRLFHGATLGELRSVTFCPRSERLGGFLGAFEKAALSSSIQNTLSMLYLFTPYSWNPNYSSLLPFTQLVTLIIESSCDGGCSSRVDDDMIISLSRAMPKLGILRLGDAPCGKISTGVTIKGLVALAHHCADLSFLRIHFQVASLSGPPAILRTDCALTELEVGDTPVPEGSALAIVLTLLHILPRLDYIGFTDEGWEEVENPINHSERVIDRSGTSANVVVTYSLIF